MSLILTHLEHWATEYSTDTYSEHQNGRYTAHDQIRPKTLILKYNNINTVLTLIANTRTADIQHTIRSDRRRSY